MKVRPEGITLQYNIMNSYQLIFKLIKVRADTYLTPADQALFHELVSLCNEQRWKEVFSVRSNVLCGNLNMSDNTLRKSRKALADANLLYFETSKDKRTGCFYSFVQKLSNDVAAPAISSELSSAVFEDDNSGAVLNPKSGSSELSSAVSSAIFEDDMQITPIVYTIKTINKESHAHTREAPPPERLASSSEKTMPFSEKPAPSSEKSDPFSERSIPTFERSDLFSERPESSFERPEPFSDKPVPSHKKPRPSRKKEADGPPLEYPFTSQRFLSVWKALRQTPKWKNKLNYALQLSLNKLGKFEEDFAIEQMERAAESNWTGVVFPGTEEKYKEWLKLKYGNNRNVNQPSKDGSGGPEPPAAGFKIIKF